MGIIAQGIITLSSVNDAFSVSLSPSSCVINADYNGKNPKLTYAYSDIKVIRGEVAVAFDMPKVVAKTNAATVDIIPIDDTTWRVQILSIPVSDLNGSFQLEIKAGIDFQTVVTFAYTVVRETSMLDWILDWNGTYTEISGKWIITPKIFAGIKDAQNRITGVYLGPSFDDNGSTGLYGYKDDNIIFQLTETGGLIGGWNIDNGGIQTADGYLKILSEGTIISAPNGKMAWELLKDGSASFAGGNVHFYANGDADFSGKITSQSGEIGGWIIGNHSLRSNYILIDSEAHFIGISGSEYTYGPESTAEQFHNRVKLYGGVVLHHTNANYFGIEGWLPCGSLSTITEKNRIFSLGNLNYIAGWYFDTNALYIGSKNNTARQNTAASGDITIGTAGMRGMNWYIDHDGEISFVGGLLHFDKNGGTISGWNLNPHRFATKHAALISQESFCGLYLTMGDIADCADGLVHSIVSKKGGIEIVADDYQSHIWAWESDGTPSFYLSTSPDDVNWIGGWCFDRDAIFRGPKKIVKGTYTDTECVTLGVTGLRGPAWRLESDGSGALAKGNISWDEKGNVTFANSVKISWAQVTGTDVVTNKLTKIDANGIYTGTISADKITAGTISTASIKCEGKWELNTDGSGFLASQAISWTKDGVMSIKSGTIGGFIIGEYCIGAKNELDYNGISNAEFGNLIIQRDFFRVGAQNGYVMFGDDVIPATVGRAFTAVGRIVNKQPNYSGSYGFDQANYGLFIDVTGGTKNYGISSNAALMAPSFIATKGQVLAFDSSGTYKVDVSQLNTILLYAPTDTNMTLPPESSIARQFGFQTLPDDFCATINIVLYNGSKTVILKNIHNGSGVKDYPLSLESYVFNRQTINFNPVKLYVDEVAPSSITLLVTKIGGFRYQVLSYASTNSVHM